jgi:carbon storage regulator
MQERNLNQGVIDMLCLTRKLNETIRINDDIEIVVIRLTGNRVKIGVQAPQDVKVLRGELAERDKRDAA